MYVTEFNFVVAGIATFAATVGYACTRRLSISLSGPNGDQIRETLTPAVEKAAPSSLEEDSNMVFETSTAIMENAQDNGRSLSIAPTRTGSLKRKVPHDGFDEPEKPQELGYPHNLANIYPNKRSRTPSTESETTPPITVTPSSTLDSIVSETADDVDVDIPLVSQDPEPIVVSPAPEPPRTPSPVAEESSPRTPSPTPAPQLLAISFAPQPVVPQPFTPRLAADWPTKTNSTASVFASPSGGFAAFAGSSSPFGAVSKPQQPSFTTGRSIWNFGDLVTHQNDEGETECSQLADPFQPKLTSKETHALEEARAVLSPSTTKYTHFTGEEDEDVEMELKGVKLFTKRGSKPFAEGVAGHLKLLSNRTTLEERILFRREPLWKVSMNVRVQPAVRCVFVPEENVLRLMLKEGVDTSLGDVSKDVETKQELVIYALKPGRFCSKQDFKDFAETLSRNSHFKTSRSATS